uniref:DNA-dependent metalloprotease SPRTN n=1 Tax=Sparus aurata TaxID=8175 RepID=A0A671VK46_SPAAU
EVDTPVAGGGSDVVPYWKPTARPERPLSIVDESWETLDPNPDVRSMFLEFNDTFFWGKLSGVEVKWSPRMTLCAGVCSYEGRGGLCSIRLSEPLLKLRPRRDLVQTLLHEMIHALLFVTQNNRDRDGHGPEFCKHMNRINQATGTKITVYHSFHDEVDVYRQHWWKCDGPCQNQKPYFGFVKRAMNRAPSALDPWWEAHRRSCGGTYTKVKEPEGYGKKGKKDGKKDGKTSSERKDIRNIIPFAGKGFLLGGKSQSSVSSAPSQKPAVKAPSSSPISSQKTLFPPSSPANSLSPPVRPTQGSLGISNAFPPVRPATSTGQKPPIKRSVGNTRVFTNISGSPVRIPKPHKGSSSSQDTKIKQRSIGELFGNTSPRKSESQSSSSNTGTKRDTPGAAGGGQASRKRPWDERSSSAAIFNFFQKTLASDSAASRESAKTNSPAMQQRTAAASSSSNSSTSSIRSSAGLHTVTPSSPSSSSSALMVSCPVCQAKVQESKINVHLDSCLS